MVVRPEALRLSTDKEVGDLTGKVVERRYTGPLTYYSVLLDMEGELDELSDREDQLPSVAENPHSVADRTIKVIGAPRAAEVGQRVFVRQRPRPPAASLFSRRGVS